jgi:uncharacterized protein
MSQASPGALYRSQPTAFGAGALISTLGGLIGLGGAEFRLPLLISYFGFQGFGGGHPQQGDEPRGSRVGTAVPGAHSSVRGHRRALAIIVNLLAGSLVGAWARSLRRVPV